MKAVHTTGEGPAGAFAGAEWLPFALVAIVWALALPVDVMDVDAAQYAHLSRELVDSGQWLEITNRGARYLDKPPLTFWLSALSFRLFGVGTVAYKLPSILAAVLATVSTFGLARRHGREVAKLAALFVASSQAIFLVTNDCRTDTLLLGAVTFACWQLSRHLETGRALPFVLAFVGVGFAMLAKGPVGAVIPVLAFGADAALKRDWRRIFAPKWLLGGVIAFVLLVPMLVGLHRQWGADGLRFFFWTQSFGRITGENVWKNQMDPLFFVHTLLWAFLPWSAALLGGFGGELRALWKARLRLEPTADAVPIAGLVLTTLALSQSQYKLPHYIFVVLPFAAILSARWLVALASQEPAGRAIRSLAIVDGVLCAVLLGLATSLAGFVFPTTKPLPWIALGASLIGAIVLARRPSRLTRIVGPPLAAILGLNVVLATHFYPSLVRYQGASQAAQLASARGFEARVVAFPASAYSLDFHLRRAARVPENLEEIRTLASAGPLWVYASADGLAKLREGDLDLGETLPFDDFSVTRLTGSFLSPTTRPTVLRTVHLVEVRATRPGR